MKIREWIEDHSGVATALAVIALGIAAAFFYFRFTHSTGASPSHTYFYDLGSDQVNPIDRLFPADANEVPPIGAPSGKLMPDGTPAGVKAWVFSCGNCGDRASLFVGYLESGTKEYRDALIQFRKATKGGQQVTVPPLVMSHRGQFLSLPDNIRWFEYASSTGQKIISDVETRCGGDPPQPCNVPIAK
jgi:hypothetical protein